VGRFFCAGFLVDTTTEEMTDKKNAEAMASAFFIGSG
jgi:hypothetical protein